MSLLAWNGTTMLTCKFWLTQRGEGVCVRWQKESLELLKMWQHSSLLHCPTIKTSLNILLLYSVAEQKAQRSISQHRSYMTSGAGRFCSSTCLAVASAPISFEFLHRIIGWKRPSRLSSPTINTTPPCLLNHVLKCNIYMFFEHLQGWGLHHFPGQPIPMSDHSFSKEIFPNIQSKSP